MPYGVGAVVSWAARECGPQPRGSGQARAEAIFAVKMTGMQSLPIMGLGYRWSLDFAGPLVTTRSKKRFVLIGIEHFSKWCEVWTLPSKGGGGVPGGHDAVWGVCRASDGQRARVCR
jgi:hypothetical protein